MHIKMDVIRFSNEDVIATSNRLDTMSRFYVSASNKLYVEDPSQPSGWRRDSSLMTSIEAPGGIYLSGTDWTYGTSGYFIKQPNGSWTFTPATIAGLE